MNHYYNRVDTLPLDNYANWKPFCSLHFLHCVMPFQRRKFHLRKAAFYIGSNVESYAIKNILHFIQIRVEILDNFSSNAIPYYPLVNIVSQTLHTAFTKTHTLKRALEKINFFSKKHRK